MTKLTYVFHNFIMVYHHFCFRKRVEIFFPFMFLVTFSVIYFNLHFLVMGGDYCFFDNCEWGVAEFFWHLKISPASPPSAIHYERSLMRF